MNTYDDMVKAAVSGQTNGVWSALPFQQLFPTDATLDPWDPNPAAPAEPALDALAVGENANEPDEQTLSAASVASPGPPDAPKLAKAPRKPTGKGDTRSAWAQDLLTRLGMPLSQSNINFMIAWQAKEGGDHTGGHNEGGRFNPLNTTHVMPGATAYNSVGVRNYTSYEQGMSATIYTMKLPYYTDILAAMHRDDVNAAISALARSPWGTGNISDVYSAVLAGQHEYDTDLFGGGAARPTQQGVPTTDVGAWYAKYQNGRIPQSALTQVGSSGFYARSDAAYAMNAMMAAARADGVALTIGGAYRDYAGQVAAYARYKAGGNLAAVPGTSEHGWGLAFDMNMTTENLRWTAAHADEFGFSDDVGGENWHWHYLGGYTPAYQGTKPKKRKTGKKPDNLLLAPQTAEDLDPAKRLSNSVLLALGGKFT